MLLQKKALQKKALQKKALDFCLENQSCDRRKGCSRGPKLGTYSDWGLSSVLVINKHLSHHLHLVEDRRRLQQGEALAVVLPQARF